MFDDVRGTHYVPSGASFVYLLLNNIKICDNILNHCFKTGLWIVKAFMLQRSWSIKISLKTRRAQQEANKLRPLYFIHVVYLISISLLDADSLCPFDHSIAVNFFIMLTVWRTLWLVASSIYYHQIINVDEDMSGSSSSHHLTTEQPWSRSEAQCLIGLLDRLPALFGLSRGQKHLCTARCFFANQTEGVNQKTAARKGFFSAFKYGKLAPRILRSSKFCSLFGGLEMIYCECTAADLSHPALWGQCWDLAVLSPESWL